MKNLKIKTVQNFRLTFTAMFLFVALGISQTALSQVTIGSTLSPDQNALLDLTQGATTTKGLLLPRVNLVDETLSSPMSAHVAGMTVYNLATSPDDGSVEAENKVSPGFYFNNGNRWERLHVSLTNWFYMPAFIFDVSVPNPPAINLYNEYLKQFGSIPAVNASPGAPLNFKEILQPEDLHYYVTGYDARAITIEGITANGELTYTVNLANVTEETFMNIVFVEKK